MVYKVLAFEGYQYSIIIVTIEATITTKKFGEIKVFLY